MSEALDKLMEKNRDVEVIVNKMDGEEKLYSTRQRFGYFSIPYSSAVGDRYYSQGRKKVYKTENNKVITEPRGIFSKPTKSGYNACFSNEIKQDMKMLKELAGMAEKERTEYLNKVKQSKSKEKTGNMFSFKPGGPQGYKDFFDQNKINYTVPITKEIDKKLKINKEAKSVYMENRGIFTKPGKHGGAMTPGVMFNYYTEDKSLLNKKKQWGDDDEKKRIAKKPKDSGGNAFKPASLVKNDNFQKDKEAYGEDQGKLKQLINEALEV